MQKPGYMGGLALLGIFIYKIFLSQNKNKKDKLEIIREIDTYRE